MPTKRRQFLKSIFFNLKTLKMKNLSRLNLYLAVLIFLGIGLFSCKNSGNDVTARIQKTNNELMDAVAKGDTAALSNFYTSDARIFPNNNEIIDGKIAIGKFWSATLQMGIKKVLFETVVAQKFGDLAIEEGKYVLYAPGDQVVDQGKYIVTWKLEGGTWKIFRDIWNANTSATAGRAQANDSVLIVMNDVKPGKVAQFENFNKNFLLPAAAETNMKTKATVRTLKPLRAGKDGTFSYVYLMDPFIGTYNYDIQSTLAAKYGKEKSAEYMKMYLDCLKDGTSQAFLTVQTGW
jgi:ketosteroid isomerase-like protein